MTYFEKGFIWALPRRLLARATHPFCRWKVSDISPVPSGEFHSTTQRNTRCYARYTRLRSCFPKGRGRHRCEGVRRKDCSSADDVIWKILYVVYFKRRPPKLAYLKYASRLQTVSKHHRGWRGVANKGTSPRACGWEVYLPPSLNGRSGARHQPLPYWQFLDRTPYTIPALRRPFHKGASAEIRSTTLRSARYDIF